MFQSVAISLALSESLLCLLNHAVGQSAHGMAHQISTTLFWTIGLVVCAGFYLVGGFLDPQTLAFLDATLKRRGQSSGSRQMLETRATGLWLGMLAGLPLVVTTTVALARTHNVSEFMIVARTSGLSLCVAEACALLVLGAVHGLRGLNLTSPRRLIALVVFGPEILRAIDPAIPTLYTLVENTQLLVFKWSVWS
jgi:hypothetical protein